MQKLCIILIIILASFSAISQVRPYDPDKVNKKAVAQYEAAIQVARNGDYREGIRILQQAVTTDPGFLDAYLSIAGLFGELKDYQQAIANYEKAKGIDAAYFNDYALPYAINLAGKGDFEKALKAVDEFLAITNLNAESRKAGEYRRKTFEFAIENAKKNPVGDYKFEPHNLGDSINTKELEYFPALTIDGRELIFTRRLKGLNEDFFSATRVDGHWTTAKALTGNINSNNNEGGQNISQDGQILVFTGCNFPGGYGGCDLYISYLTADGWSAAENLGRRINTESWESAPSLSPDKRDLYFTSDRPGGYGGSDIYVCHRMANGRYGDPENAGPEVNTIGNESSPFIHADNQTLYFTSNGHLGYGGDDLFMVKRQPKNTWSKAINLGYPINTIENEGSLVVTADSKTAYYASDRSDTKGGLDIYTFEMRKDIRPSRTLWVKGKVFDKKTTKGLPSAVELTDLSTQEVLSKVQTDETGSYLVTLPVGKDYAFNVNRKGYLFFSENFSLSQGAPDSTYNVDIPLQPIEPNAIIVLKNIFFETNQYELKKESTSELDKIVILLQDNPNLKIQINGHTDNVGKDKDNLLLSNNRAQSVVKYIIAKGIDQQRLAFKGFGATMPVAANTTEEGRAKNRRTELKVVSQ